MQENEAAALLKKHQQAITIMEHHDYDEERKLVEHTKLSK